MTFANAYEAAETKRIRIHSKQLPDRRVKLEAKKMAATRASLELEEAQAAEAAAAAASPPSRQGDTEAEPPNLNSAIKKARLMVTHRKAGLKRAESEVRDAQGKVCDLEMSEVMLSKTLASLAKAANEASAGSVEGTSGDVLAHFQAARQALKETERHCGDEVTQFIDLICQRYKKYSVDRVGTPDVLFLASGQRNGKYCLSRGQHPPKSSRL